MTKTLKIRESKTSSGATSVQVVFYDKRKTIIAKHIGCGRSQEEIELLYKQGHAWIGAENRQLELFAQEENKGEDLQFLGITHQFAYKVLESVATRCGLNVNEHRFLFDFAIMRLIEPASKLRTITLLERYFEIQYSERTVYRKVLKLIEKKQHIEEIAIKSAQERLYDDLALVLYDVTTLYFETFKSDNLRSEGFSKDNKPQQPQIVVGLIVSRQGYPLSYEVYAGKTFEGKTMLDILDKFTKRNGVKRPIVVADAAMLSHDNIVELKERNLSYIVGARLGNTSLKIIKEVHEKLKGKDGKSIRLNTDNGDLIIEFSQKRYNKDKYEMEKQILKAKRMIDEGVGVKRTKFVKQKTDVSDYSLNETLIEKNKMLLGMKGYYTNLSKSILSDKDVIERYHDLWHVEQAFRIAKSDLASRPVFHYRADAVRSHILICFTALMFAKFLEIEIKLSIKQIVDIIWSVTYAKLYNRKTGETFLLKSKITPQTQIILNSLFDHLSY
ncbi:MAG: IS1634 family transposase [Ignavibacteria bacterium]|nr:IS1634 family transposase [Ignavibacteria bacterium]MDP3831312.1 IS1634 family transposase [Ignavibacteriaceae bacterium]